MFIKQLINPPLALPITSSVTLGKLLLCISFIYKMEI